MQRCIMDFYICELISIVLIHEFIEIQVILTNKKLNTNIGQGWYVLLIPKHHLEINTLGKM